MRTYSTWTIFILFFNNFELKYVLLLAQEFEKWIHRFLQHLLRLDKLSEVLFISKFQEETGKQIAFMGSVMARDILLHTPTFAPIQAIFESKGS